MQDVVREAIAANVRAYRERHGAAWQQGIDIARAARGPGAARRAYGTSGSAEPQSGVLATDRAGEGSDPTDRLDIQKPALARGLL